MAIGRAEYIRNECRAFYAKAEGARKEQKITKTELAKSLGISAKTLQRNLENGKLQIRHMYTLRYLLGIDNDPEKELLRKLTELNRKIDLITEGRKE